jgi:hypothetical protein
MAADTARRGAWTRIDLIVLLGVAVVGLGVVAIVIVRAREPAQRVECANHIQAMGKAFHAYHDRNKALPSSCIAPGYATWAVQILPFLAQHASQGSGEWDLAAPYFAQTDAARTTIAVTYLCPARVRKSLVAGEQPPQGAQTATLVYGAVGDYACAPTSDTARYPWDGPLADGALIVGEVREKKDAPIQWWRSRVRLEDLARGQSHTILVGEKHVPEDGLGQTAFGDGSIFNGERTASFARLVDADHPLAAGPSAAFQTNFGSWHPDVCQFLMADASLRVFTNTVDPTLLQRLIRRFDTGGD